VNELRFGRGELGDPDVAARLEWRVTNGIGGFAAGTLSGELAHRGHGLLFAAEPAPRPATLVLAKLAATLELGGKSHALDTSAWKSGALDPVGHRHLESVRLEDGLPVWVWSIGGTRLEHRVWMERGENTTYAQYRLRSSPGAVRLRLHALVNHRSATDVVPRGDWTARIEPAPGGLCIQAWEGATPLWLTAPGAEVHPRHDWYRDYRLRSDGPPHAPAHEDHLLAAEIVAGLEPGDEFTVVASTRKDAATGIAGSLAIVSAHARRNAHERGLLEAWRREHPQSARHAAPWVQALVTAAADGIAEPTGGVAHPGAVLFSDACTTSDPARDTLLALPGLTLATGRAGLARDVLEYFGERLSGGVPPRAPGDERPATADATLWLVQALRAYFEHTLDTGFLATLFPRLETALEALASGAQAGVSADATDGLLRTGGDGAPATWMDTQLAAAGLPMRQGKAVETNALWYNAHTAMAAFARRLRAGEPWEKQATKIERGFARFWNADAHCLYDVLDGPHGTDASIRPNQILALSLPDSPLSASQRRAVLARCARDLATSHGLRSLSLDDPRHIDSETGDAVHDARTAVMGSAWTWLLPHYALATLRVHGDRAAALELLEPLEGLMRGRGLGMLPERSDSARPHAGRGAACRAWATAETLRAYRLLTGPRRDMRRRESTHAKDAAPVKPRRTAAAFSDRA